MQRMSQVSGIRRLKAQTHGTTGAVPPEYGVECKLEIGVYMTRVSFACLIFKKAETFHGFLV